MKTSAIDLFCGVGGLSYGLQQAGVNVEAGFDVDESCRYAYEENVKASFTSEDIAETSGTRIVENHWRGFSGAKILVGCAPCQPFSSHSNKNRNKRASGKWHLINEFRRIIEETEPEIVSMENVPNLANQAIFREFVEFLRNKEFSVTHRNVYCPDYGIPQKRRRLVLIASRYGDIDLIPVTHSKELHPTLRSAIGDLPPVQAGEICVDDKLHRSRKLSEINLRRIQASKPNGTWQDWDEELVLACHKKSTGQTYQAVYGRMAWDEPASTITTQFHNYGTGRFGHPTQDRALTIREAALIQTFPIDYKFCENELDISITDLGIKIGNAVPVRLGTVIGESIIAHLEIYHDK